MLPVYVAGHVYASATADNTFNVAAKLCCKGY